MNPRRNSRKSERYNDQSVSNNSQFPESEKQAHWLLRIPPVVFWTVLASLVLFLVYFYDHHEVVAIRELQLHGTELQATGQYQEAIDSYEQAFKNSRASNRKKGELASQIADLYFDKMNNPAQASYWYILAKRYYPKILSNPERAALLRERISMMPEKNETSSETRQLRLFVQPPPGDSTGRIFAKFDGGCIYENSILRGSNSDTLTSESIEQFIQNEMLFQAAVQTGYLEKPEVIADLFDYQKHRVIKAYLNDTAAETETSGALNSTQYDRLKKQFHLKMQ